LAIGMLLLGRAHDPEAIQSMLFGSTAALDRAGLITAGLAASATLISLALFLRGLLGEGADPVFMRTTGARFGAAHLLLMLLLALNLVAGFRAFGALMTVALMTVPAAAARFWAKGYGGQACAAIAMSALSGLLGLGLSSLWGVQPGAVMTLCAAGLFALSAVFGVNGGLLSSRRTRAHLRADSLA
ncbi:MAG TPA: metal ABC transporter permease, partial [Caulobacteraceae bacterium]|nr:metal ABC transporter permease [Caulobacteraceae bacterium]